MMERYSALKGRDWWLRKGATQMAPFQGSGALGEPLTQGVALGYLMLPLWGRCLVLDHRPKAPNAIARDETGADRPGHGIGYAHGSSVPTGHHAIARGIAPGIMMERYSALKGRPNGWALLRYF